MHENAVDGQSLLAPLREARGSLGPIGRLIVLAPPHPAIGIGELRVLRVDPADAEGRPTVIVSYEGYERLA
ncbi:hypothetical protein EPN44_06550 [bacterium]|nr:MAG: hypothetical protein EPN44_06550 [bacterium]